ncbi:MAG: RNA ligase (ATP), partial [Mycobacteriales bacterium]
MATLRVTAEQLTIFPHPNADALELAQVGLYRAVVPKGVYSTGDYALYIPEQAILPDSLIAELGLTGRLAGSKKNRIRAIRLRGELSQGIVFRPAVVPEVDLAVAHAQGRDFAEMLGIT